MRPATAASEHAIARDARDAASTPRRHRVAARPQSRRPVRAARPQPERQATVAHPRPERPARVARPQPKRPARIARAEWSRPSVQANRAPRRPQDDRRGGRASARPAPEVAARLRVDGQATPPGVPVRVALRALQGGALAASSLAHGRGSRGWRLQIPVVAALLVGLVFINVDLLRVNKEIAGYVDRSVELKRANSSLGAKVARLQSSERILRRAALSGLTMPTPEQFAYRTSRPDLDFRRAVARMVSPRPTAAAPSGTAPGIAQPPSTIASPGVPASQAPVPAAPVAPTSAGGATPPPASAAPTPSPAQQPPPAGRHAHDGSV